MASPSLTAGRQSALGNSPKPTGRLHLFISRLRSGDETAHLITLLFAASVLAITGLLLYELIRNPALSLHTFGWKFVGSSTWDPVFEHFGALPFIYGTLVTAGVALVIAVPLGLGAAIFLAELAPPAI